MDIAELSRKVENMIRIGTVAEVDHGARRVRVQSGSLLTEWLKWRVGRAGETRTWDPPTVGEQVMILSPSGVIENGIVMPSIYSDAADSPSSSPSEHVIDFPDGARLRYDHQTGALEATGITTALVAASDAVTVNAGENITLNAGEQIEIVAPMIVIRGEIMHTDGALSSNEVVLHTHVHTGVQPGPVTTGGPQ